MNDERRIPMRRFPLSMWAAIVCVSMLASCGAPKVVRRPERPEKPRPVRVERLDHVPVVRVLIIDGSQSVRLRIPEAFYIGEGEAGENLTKFDRGGDFSVTRGRNAIEVGDGKAKLFEAPAVMIRRTSKKNTYINGKPYRGDFVFRLVHGRIMTINVLELDDYIKGVLPVEMGYLKSNQYEAYRAQAIASRSYALSKLDEKKADMYDLKATIMDQVYKGVLGETVEASGAVDDTKGMVAFWEGEPVRAYYSSCCGGHTADIRVCWPWKTPYPYLHGVRDSENEPASKSFCRRSPHFRWRVHWSGGTLARVLKETLPEEMSIREEAIGTLQDITVTETAHDGRIAAIEIITDKGTHLVEGDKIRWVLRPSVGSDAILKSTMFKMSVKKGRGRVLSLNIVGGGNGHGVGMCQTGAIQMAELGYSAEEIIEHYYPGVTVYRYYD
jgi:stage II sporulation protein D